MAPLDASAGDALLHVLLTIMAFLGVAIWRDVFAHRWGPDQVAAAVWVGVACGVFVCVPAGSWLQALVAGPLFGATAWLFAEIGIRDRRRRLPRPPLLPPPPPRAEV